MKRLAIIGSGDLGRLIAHHAQTDRHYVVVGFFDDFCSAGTPVRGCPVFGGVSDVVARFQAGDFDELMIGIGYKHLTMRRQLFDRFRAVLPLGRVVHSSCYVDVSAKVGAGSFLLPGCVLDLNAVVGENVLLNTGCCIAHDSTVLAHTFMSPRVALAGFVQIGEGCNIGINTTVIDNIRIGAGIQTGGGTVVTQSLTKPGLYVGVPARFVR
jgi:sugar O-acyltransferase (sialic acid O-acetyltransferase NeuD family)